MPNVTTTIRQLKNKETGLDLAIPTFAEKSGFIQKTFEFHVVAVSRLACFKTPQHKDTDIVQFMIPKHVDDFEVYRKSLDAKFPGTVLPPLPKTLFTIVEGTAKEQVSQLDKFLKFVAGTQKLATCPETLRFLGFGTTAARGLGQQSLKQPSHKKNLFEEEAEGEDSQTGLFGSDPANDSDDDDDLFRPALVESPDKKSTDQRTSTKLFEDQDYGSGVAIDDELVMIAGVFQDTHQESPVTEDPEEQDLLNIDDNFQDLLRLKPESKSSVTDNRKLSSDKPPVTSPKPMLPPKPGSKKPMLPPKPGAVRNKEVISDKTTDPVTQSNTAESIGTDDILKYIQDNVNDDEDLDLFS